jgi:hypothetical protein
LPFWTQKRNTNTGGVTSIIAGTNITISPSGGTGNVTISSGHSVVVFHVDGSTTNYDASSNTDLARGVALMSAISAVSLGDSICLSPGIFDIDTNGITQSFKYNIYGSGMYTTTIITNTSGNGMQLVSESVISDFTFNHTFHDYILTITTGGALNVMIKNIRVFGHTDVMWLDSSSLIYIDGCELYGSIAGVQSFNNSIVYISNSKIVVSQEYDNVGSTVQDSALLANSGGKIYAKNCIIEANGQATGTVDVAVHTSNTNPTAQIWLYGCTISVSGTGSLSNLQNGTLAGNNSIFVDDKCVYDPGLTSGTINTIGAGGSQTPWTSDIDGGNFNLTNVNNAQVNNKINNELSVNSVIASPSTTVTSNTPWLVKPQGSYLYVSSQLYNTIDVIDVTEPLNPVLISTFSSTLGRVIGICPAGDVIYCTIDNGDLEVVDISNPMSPVSVTSIGGLSATYSMSISGTTLIVSSVTTIYEVNVRLPSAPVITATYSTLNITDIADQKIRGSFLYMVGQGVSGSYSAAIEIWNISTPGSFTYSGSYTDPTANVSSGIELFGNYALVNNYYGSGDMVYSITDPTNPYTLNLWSHPNDYSFGSTVAGNWWVVGDGTLILIYDARTVSSGTPVPVLTIPAGSINGLCISGNILYATDLGSGVLSSYDLNGIKTTSADISSLKVGKLDVSNDAVFSQNMTVGTGVSVGHGGVASMGTISGRRLMSQNGISGETVVTSGGVRNIVGGIIVV